MIEIIPSLLTSSEEDFTTKVRSIADSVQTIQIDIADGIFVPNTTWADAEKVKDIVTTDLEVHLMVANPLEVIKAWKDVPQVKRVLMHVESVEDIGAALTELRQYGWDIGLVLKPKTPIDILEPHIDNIQGAMCMGVNPGFQGQPFVPETIERLKEIKTRWPQLFVELDGAVNETTLPNIVTTGLDAVCPGSAIVGNERTGAENVKQMKELITSLTQ